MAAALRFVEISKEFLDNLKDNSIPENTKRATKYGMKIFNGKFSGLLLRFFFTRQNYELFHKFKTNPVLLSSISFFNILSLFLIIEWFQAKQNLKQLYKRWNKKS